MAAHPITETLLASADFGPLYYVAGKNQKTQGHVFKAAVYNSTDGGDLRTLTRSTTLSMGSTL